MGHYSSFVVRIWTTREGRFHGWIEHAGSQARMLFLEPEAMLQFIDAHLQSLPGTVPDPEEEIAAEDGDDKPVSNSKLD